MLSQRRFECLFVVGFFVGMMFLSDILRMQEVYAAQMPLPASDELVRLSQKYDEPTLRGIKVDPTNPFKLTFVYDKGTDGAISDATAKELVQYFFAALVTPTKDLWVNLSPFEKDRVIEDAVAETEIGDVFLAQDYLLKQLSSSLTSPDTETGKAYWAVLASKSEISSLKSENSSINKIWITPGKIKVYSDKTTTMIADAQLDVQTEHDYLAAKESVASVGANNHSPVAGVDSATKNVLLPAIIKDVNEGKNFASLRQMMHAIILAQLFKSKYGASVYAALIDSGKDKGLETGDPAMKGDVFEKYVSSFQNGVYRTTAKVRDAAGLKTKREYFCGGVSSAIVKESVETVDAKMIESSGFVEQTYRIVADTRQTIYPPSVEQSFNDIEHIVQTYQHGTLSGDRAHVLFSAPVIWDWYGRLVNILAKLPDSPDRSALFNRAGMERFFRLSKDTDALMSDIALFSNDVKALWLQHQKESVVAAGVQSKDTSVNGGIDLSGIVGKITLEGTGDPWNGQRMTMLEVSAMTGVTLTAAGGLKPFVLSPVAAK